MTEIDSELYTMIEALKQSKTYREYDRRRVALKSDPELKKRVDAYRLENYTLQTQEDDGTLQERIEEFARSNMGLSEDPRVRPFLDAESALCRMLQEITDRIINAINFE
ncbi:MAG: YlbF family regulator [Lachnospiraceae bacterium]|nr:YlbF family regulator [Lachnospiraceae bacterium]